MKLSLSWIFDHLEADMSQIDSNHLIAQFNRTTAEIEHSYTIQSDVTSMHCVRVINSTVDKITTTCPASGENYILPTRSDVVIGQWYLIKQDGNTIRWCTATDLGGSKEYLIPAIEGQEIGLTDAWRSQLELHDVILDIDNKSINNRPDLWGHRGIAREIGAMLDIPLKPLELAQIPITTQETVAGYTIANHAERGCKRFAALILPSCQPRPCPLWMAHRLIRVDARVINCMVDATNYVMFDLGQPLHAFDAHKLAGNTLTATYAHAGQSMTLLDGHEISLASEDMVISDAQGSVALAGIMGGQRTAITSSTNALVVEAASFDASTIRTTAMRYKKRTDASARFEKSLDPNQNTVALQRFALLIEQSGVIDKTLGTIISCGADMQPGHIELTHAYIQDRLGINIEHSFIIKTLTKLGFECREHEGNYHITVPTFRATKDVLISEDIVEEIARLWGYNYIAPQLPVHQAKPHDLRPLQRLRIIKNMLAHSCGMTELSCYPFFDTSFLHIMQWQPADVIRVQNPVSENWTMLASSLIPMLLRAVHENYTNHDSVRFFQVGRVWKKNSDGSITEENRVAGVFFDKKQPISFYDTQHYLQQLFDVLAVDVTWNKADETAEPWYLAHQTARIAIHDTTVGYLGVINPLLVAHIVEGYATLFECNVTELMHSPIDQLHYKPLSKYPAVHRDISVLIPMRYTAYDIQQAISSMHPLITNIALLDFFEKAEWGAQRSLTFRYTLQSLSKTLTTQEIDAIHASIIQELHTTFQAVIR